MGLATVDVASAVNDVVVDFVCGGTAVDMAGTGQNERARNNVST